METPPVISPEVRPPALPQPSYETCRPEEPYVPPGMQELPGYSEQHAKKYQALLSNTEAPADKVRFSELVQCSCPHFPENKIVGVFVEKGQRYLKLEYDPQHKTFQIHACPCQTATLESDLLPKYSSPHPETGKEVLFCFNELHRQLQQFQFGESGDEYIQVQYPELAYDPSLDIEDSDVYNPRIGIMVKKRPYLQTWKKQEHRFAQLANVPVRMLETSVPMVNFNHEVDPVDSEDRNILDFINTLPPLKAHFCPCREIMGVAVKNPSTGKYSNFEYQDGRFTPLSECENCNDKVTQDCLIPSYVEFFKELNAHLVHVFNTKTLVNEQYMFNLMDSEFKQVYIGTLVYDESRRSNTDSFFFHPSSDITVYHRPGLGLGVAKICEDTKASQSVVVPVNTLVMQKEKKDQERRRRREAEAEEAARNARFQEQLFQNQDVVLEHVENTIPDEVLKGILERRRIAQIAKTQAQPSDPTASEHEKGNGEREASEGTATTPETSALPPPAPEVPAANPAVSKAPEAPIAAPVAPEDSALAQTDPETPEGSTASPQVSGALEEFIHTEKLQPAPTSTTEPAGNQQELPAAPVTQNSPVTPPRDIQITPEEERPEAVAEPPAVSHAPELEGQTPETEDESARHAAQTMVDPRAAPESAAETTEDQQEASLAPDAQQSLEAPPVPTTTTSALQNSPEAPEPSATSSTNNPSSSDLPGPSSTPVKKERRSRKFTEAPSPNDGGQPSNVSTNITPKKDGRGRPRKNPQSGAPTTKAPPTKRSKEMTASEEPARPSDGQELEPLEVNSPDQDEGAAPPVPKKNRGQKSAEGASADRSKAPKKTQSRSRSTTTTGAKRRRGREVTPDEQLLEEPGENPEISTSEFDPPNASQDGATSSQAGDAQISSSNDTAAPPAPKRTSRRTTAQNRSQHSPQSRRTTYDRDARHLKPSTVAQDFTSPPEPAKTRKRTQQSAQRQSESEASSQNAPPKKSRSRSTKKAKASDPGAEDPQVNANPSEASSTQEIQASDQPMEPASQIQQIPDRDLDPTSATTETLPTGKDSVVNNGSLSDDTSSADKPQPQSSVASSSTPTEQKRRRTGSARDSSTDASLPTQKGTPRKPTSGRNNRHHAGDSSTDPSESSKKRAPSKGSKTMKTGTLDADAYGALTPAEISALETRRSESTPPPPLIDATDQEFNSNDGMAPLLSIQQAHGQASGSHERTPMNQGTGTPLPLASQSPESRSPTHPHVTPPRSEGTSGYVTGPHSQHSSMNPSSADASYPGSPQHQLNPCQMPEHVLDGGLETHRTPFYGQIPQLTTPRRAQPPTYGPPNHYPGQQLGFQGSSGHHLHPNMGQQYQGAQFDPVYIPQNGIQFHEMTNVFSNQDHQMTGDMPHRIGYGGPHNGTNGYADSMMHVAHPHSGYTQVAAPLGLMARDHTQLQRMQTPQMSSMPIHRSPQHGQSPWSSDSSGSFQNSPANGPGPSEPARSPFPPGPGTSDPIDVRYLQIGNVHSIDAMALNGALASRLSNIGSESGQNSDVPPSTTTDALISETSRTSKRRRQSHSTFGKKRKSAKPKVVDPNKLPAPRRPRKRYEPSTKPNEHKMSTRAKADEERRLDEYSQLNQERKAASGTAPCGEEFRGDSTSTAPALEIPQVQVQEVPQGEGFGESGVLGSYGVDPSREASATSAKIPQDPDEPGEEEEEEEALGEDTSSSASAPKTEAFGTTSGRQSLAKITVSGTGSSSSSSASVVPQGAAPENPSLAQGDASGEHSSSSTPETTSADLPPGDHSSTFPAPVIPQVAAPEHLSSSTSSGNPSLVRDSPSPSNTDGLFREHGLTSGNSESPGNPLSPSTGVTGPPSLGQLGAPLSPSSNTELFAPGCSHPSLPDYFNEGSIDEESSYGPSDTSPSPSVTIGTLEGPSTSVASKMSIGAAAHVPGSQPQVRQSHGPGAPSSIESPKYAHLNYPENHNRNINREEKMAESSVNVPTKSASMGPHSYH